MVKPHGTPQIHDDTFAFVMDSCAVSLDSHRQINEKLISVFVGEGTGRISLRSAERQTAGTMLRRPGEFDRCGGAGNLSCKRLMQARALKLAAFLQAARSGI